MKYSIISTPRIDFLLIDHPNESNLDEFVSILEDNDVNYIIRISKNHYDFPIIHNKPIIIKDLFFDDGSHPPDIIINEFNKFVAECKLAYKRPMIAVHCASSYGRAPCLIALEIINTKMFTDRYDVVKYIRDSRNSCFNTKQVGWILGYSVPSVPSFAHHIVQFYSKLIQFKDNSYNFINEKFNLF